MREDDKIRLFELHPNDFDILRENFRGETRQTKIDKNNGFVGIKAILPPPTRRAVVLIDPPYEEKQDYERVVHTLKEAQKRFAQGCYLVWYPCLSREESRKLPAQLQKIAETMDEATGISSKVVIDWKQQPKGSDLKPRITLRDKPIEQGGKVVTLDNGIEARYFLSVDAVLSVTRGRTTYGGGIGYANRKLFNRDDVPGVTLYGIEDQSAYGQLFLNRQLSPVSTIDGNLFVNYYESGVAQAAGVWAYGGTASYGHSFGRITTSASAGVYAFDTGDLDTTWSAQALIAARYSF